MRGTADERPLLEHTRSFRRQGGIYLAGAGLLMLLWNAADESTVLKPVPGFILDSGRLLILSVAVVFLLRGVTLLRRPGHWHIRLTRERLSWSVGMGKGAGKLFRSDDSFDVALADIERIEFDDRDDATVENMGQYSAEIVLRDGMRYRVAEESGIDLRKLIDLLRRLQVRVERQ